MKPLNQADRRKGWNRFLRIYALSLLFPITAVWLLLTLPGMVSRSETERYKAIVLEQKPLVIDIDTLGSFVRQLVVGDGEVSTAPVGMARATAQTNVSELETRLISQMSHLDRQTASLQNEHNKTLTKGVANLTKTVVDYRHLVGELRTQLNGKGGEDQVINDLRAQLTDLRNQNTMKDVELRSLERELATLRAASGGGSSGNSAKLAQLQHDLDDCKRQKPTSSNAISFDEWAGYAQAEGYYMLAKQDGISKSAKQTYSRQARPVFELLASSASSPQMRDRAKARLSDLQRNGL